MGEENEGKRQEQQEEREAERGEEMTMKPWEQHSAVISIPRYDYNAPSSLFHHSHSGFLVTCPIKREKSATKEAIAILEKIIKSYYSGTSKCLESSDANVAVKRRKVCDGENNGDDPISESKNATNSGQTDGKLPEKSCSPSSKSDTNSNGSSILSLVKLTRSGLLLFTVPRNDFPDIVDVVSNIFRSLETGLLISPSWCHRIFPIQATCCLNEDDLQSAVSKLVMQFVNDSGRELRQPIKFAVGYNRRGFEDTEAKTSRNTLKGYEKLPLLDRKKCFSVVAAAVKDVVPDAVVDLRSPEVSVLVELLPVSGIPNGSLVVAVSVLPHNLIATKPRLCIKPLLCDMKMRTEKRQ